jgi:MFS family permease
MASVEALVFGMAPACYALLALTLRRRTAVLRATLQKNRTGWPGLLLKWHGKHHEHRKPNTSNMEVNNEAIAPNAKRLLWAGFTAILATGVGFAIRGGVLDNWGAEFGFNASQLGAIGGAGLSGFCFGVIIGGVIADKIGYGKLVIAAFVLHLISAGVTLSAGGESAYNMLYWGTFIFAIANGTLESVANPLVATLFPNNRTHYLNILHAAWPAGLALGSIMGWILDDRMHIGWKVQVAIFLVPTVLYGLMFLGQKAPKSEASEKGIPLADMLKDVGILGALVVCYLLSVFFSGAVGLPPAASYAISGALLIVVAVMTKFSMGSLLLFVLFIAHALVGSVELGTDGWIQNITGNLFSSQEGKWLFIFTSAIMFGLRFCAHWIERTLKLSPVGLLLVCAILACVGLNLTSHINSFGVALLALGVYALGKTFFWPTMLAVAADRFPRTGAIAISIMGGIGMMAGGLLGGPGLGYAKDRFAGEELAQANPAAYAEYKSATPSKFLFLADATGLDGKKFGVVSEKFAKAREESNGDTTAAYAKLTPEEKAVHEASIAGDRRTLRADAFIPATMAGIFLLLLLYFKGIGGYKAVHLKDDKALQSA